MGVALGCYKYTLHKELFCKFGIVFKKRCLSKLLPRRLSQGKREFGIEKIKFDRVNKGADRRSLRTIFQHSSSLKEKTFGCIISCQKSGSYDVISFNAFQNLFMISSFYISMIPLWSQCSHVGPYILFIPI